MTVVLETQRLPGGTVVAAVVSRAVDFGHSRYHMAISGGLRPLAVLVRVGDQVDGFTPQGDPLTVPQLQALYPEVVEQLTSIELL